jgi:hypothetical protein
VYMKAKNATQRIASTASETGVTYFFSGWDMWSKKDAASAACPRNSPPA